MKINKNQYKKLVQQYSPNSHLLKNCIWAFFSGGTICLIGEILNKVYAANHFTIGDASMLTTVTLVGLSAFFTSLGWYAKLAKRAGAGTLVPTTGFANAVVSPAIEFKSEGLITGVAAKMFIIAGPVIVYGILSSVVYGIILYLKARFGLF